MRLHPPDCRHRFADARVARLATVTPDGAPFLVPVTVAVLADDAAPAGAAVVFAVDDKPKRTRELRRLEHLAAEPRAAFLVDSYDEDWSRLWWVRADTVTTVLTAGPRREAALAALVGRYPQLAGSGFGAVVWAVVQRWSGWAAA
ncbi:TIGR03668 family PPOX class F420-dependent oxidoreductase [Nakamurella leprariae]|uniref:TIGR03668 family PPOX class F420-dependent oxidoreductase n=1 Tax=Nakamurella leprariae TaxID=2803911 RepID=A0A938YFE4_9ACTN|nr:TIGR03668 family PPOX class F420-dependent oxidoreductase [Nakamurella leprariae]MBM9468874.1 TIGR03668 family PPOX class F420-dependent oxidoreductase [Nakamurella leprariae]